MSITLDRHHDITGTTGAAALAHDVRTGLTATPKTLPPKWFYDDERQPAVRGDHEAGGVLPDPAGARDPHPARPRHRGRHRCRHPRRAGLRLVGEDPAAARRPAGSRDAAPVRPGRRQRLRAGGCGRHPGARLPRAGGARQWLPTSTATSGLLPSTGAAAGRLPRRHDRQLRAGGAGQVPRCGRGEPRPGRRASCSAPTSSRTPAGCSGRTTTPAGVTARFNRNVLARGQPGARCRLRPRRVRPRRALGRRRSEWIEMRLRATRDQQVRVAALDLTVRVRRRARSCAPRSRRSSPATG